MRRALPLFIAIVFAIALAGERRARGARQQAERSGFELHEIAAQARAARGRLGQRGLRPEQGCRVARRLEPGRGLGVHQRLLPRILAEPGLRYVYEQIEMPTSAQLLRVERNGVLIDAPTLAAQSHELGLRIVQLEAEAYEIAGQPFNLASPKQLGEIFFDKLGLPVIKKTATGARSTDEEVLEKLAEDYPLPSCWRTAACPSSRAPTPTNWPSWRCRAQAVSTPTMRRPWP